MKNLLISSICMSCMLFHSLTSFSQDLDLERKKEFHLKILPLNSFSFDYKSETKKNNFFRIGLTAFDANVINTNSNLTLSNYFNSANFSIGLQIGFEKRKYFTEKISAFSGVNLYTSTGLTKYKTDDPTVYPISLRHIINSHITTGFSFNSGFLLHLNDNFSIAAEIMPMLTYSYSLRERVVGDTKYKDITNAYSAMIYNHTALVSFVYRWNGK